MFFNLSISFALISLAFLLFPEVIFFLRLSYFKSVLLLVSLFIYLESFIDWGIFGIRNHSLLSLSMPFSSLKISF